MSSHNLYKRKDLKGRFPRQNSESLNAQSRCRSLTDAPRLRRRCLHWRHFISLHDLHHYLIYYISIVYYIILLYYVKLCHNIFLFYFIDMILS